MALWRVKVMARVIGEFIKHLNTKDTKSTMENLLEGDSLIVRPTLVTVVSFVLKRVVKNYDKHKYRTSHILQGNGRRKPAQDRGSAGRKTLQCGGTCCAVETQTFHCFTSSLTPG